MIIFAWTPPHFWSLAIARREEYAKVGIPMLPVTHGIAYTRLQIVFYTVLLILCTLMPVLIGMSGLIYLAAALFLDARFLYLVFALHRGTRPDLPPNGGLIPAWWGGPGLSLTHRGDGSAAYPAST